MTDADLLDDVELVDLEDVYPYSNNPKEHPDKQIEKLVASIREFGWDQPIVTDLDGEIVKGHGRYEAAKRLGLDRVPIIRNDYENEAEKRAARIADNRTAESDWNDEDLSLELDRLLEDDFDLALTGFDDDEVDDLLDLQEPPELGEVDEEFEGAEELRVVLIAEGESDAEFIGAWADDEGFEWHVVDQ